MGTYTAGRPPPANGHLRLIEDLRLPGPQQGLRTRSADMLEWLIEERERLQEENKALRLAFRVIESASVNDAGGE